MTAGIPLAAVGVSMPFAEVPCTRFAAVVVSTRFAAVVPCTLFAAVVVSTRSVADRVSTLFAVRACRPPVADRVDTYFVAVPAYTLSAAAAAGL